jgi:hypothetical protein
MKTDVLLGDEQAVWQFDYTPVSNLIRWSETILARSAGALYRRASQQSSNVADDRLASIQ